MRDGAQVATDHADEIRRGERFEFGDNWRRFLNFVDEESVADAERSLREMLGAESLAGRRFLDIGSGSGLFSLAARRLGAEQVHSFDFDPSSVACTRELRRRYLPDDLAWTIEEGNVLDEDFVAGLGTWDVVYSWGVLHHTGDMWRALDLTQTTVVEDGMLFVSIYNDQGLRSRLWRAVKRTYNRLPPRLRPGLTALVMGPRVLLQLARALVTARLAPYVSGRTDYRSSRGMSRWRDIVDWMGGYPFEVARPEEVFAFLHDRGFRLDRLATCGGRLGCNEYVLRREGGSPAR